ALFSRMPLLRLDAESLYDTVLLVAGRLDRAPCGPADAVQVRADGLVTPVESARGWRRLIYVEQLRKQLPTHLENFDFPQMNPNCVERLDSTVAPQALYLMNNSMIEQLAAQFARRIEMEGEIGAERQIDQIYPIALRRYPRDEERSAGLRALTKLTAEWA